MGTTTAGAYGNSVRLEIKNFCENSCEGAKLLSNWFVETWSCSIKTYTDWKHFFVGCANFYFSLQVYGLRVSVQRKHNFFAFAKHRYKRT